MVGRKCVKSEDLKLQCEWSQCREIFTDLGDFYRHLDEHYEAKEDEDMTCRWNECTYVTNCQEDLLRHLYFHGYHTKVKWWGLLCHKKEKLNECRALHTRNIIPELPDGFRCEWSDCAMLCDIPDQFYMHVYEHAVFAEAETLGKGSSGYVCHWEGCNYTYETRSNGKVCTGRFKLREHLRTHTKERCYACPWCGNLYVNRTKFADHLNRQINVESHCFQCTHCSRTFATERLLKDHMRHHVNHYKCPKCAMTCPNPSGLKHHMRYKHSDARPFACQYCAYRSKTSYDLQVHLTFHQRDLSYRCHIEGCDYAVRSLQNLRYHFRTKHVEGKGKCYICHLCNKRYGVGFQLTHHLRTTHSFQWPPGHSRFKYKECEDGLFRLQTFRFESVELTEELMVHDNNPTSPSDENEASHSQSIRQTAKSFISTRRKNVMPKQKSYTTITTRSAALLLNKAHGKVKPRIKPQRSKKTLVKKNTTTDLNTTEDKRNSNVDIEVPHTELASWEDGVKPSEQPQPTRLQRIPKKASDHHIDGTSDLDVASGNKANEDGLISPQLPAGSSESVSNTQDMNLAMVDGVLSKDENGDLISVLIGGEKYYVLQGTDQVKAITYCLVNATTYEGAAS